MQEEPSLVVPVQDKHHLASLSMLRCQWHWHIFKELLGEWKKGTTNIGTGDSRNFWSIHLLFVPRGKKTGTAQASRQEGLAPFHQTLTFLLPVSSSLIKHLFGLYWLCCVQYLPPCISWLCYVHLIKGEERDPHSHQPPNYPYIPGPESFEFPWLVVYNTESIYTEKTSF